MKNFDWYKKLKEAELKSDSDWGFFDYEFFGRNVWSIIEDYEKDSKKLNIKKYSAKRSK